jgi:hypothetical protein
MSSFIVVMSALVVPAGFSSATGTVQADCMYYQVILS